MMPYHLYLSRGHLFSGKHLSKIVISEIASRKKAKLNISFIQGIKALLIMKKSPWFTIFSAYFWIGILKQMESPDHHSCMMNIGNESKHFINALLLVLIIPMSFEWNYFSFQKFSHSNEYHIKENCADTVDNKIIQKVIVILKNTS